MPREAKKRKSRSRKGTRASKRTTQVDVQPQTNENLRDKMLSEMSAAGYNRTHFVEMLEASVTAQRRRVKSARRNRFVHYCTWAHALLRSEIGPSEAEYSFPQSILEFIRFLVPGDIKGEIREDAYKVKMDEFCKAMELAEA